LEDKVQLIALNKVDLADGELVDAFAKELQAAGADKVFPLSGATGEGVENLLNAVLQHLPDRTSTETKGKAEENTAEAEPWSPL
jgi:GTP-binding protein